VMLYLGIGDAIIHAPFTGRSVEVVILPPRRTGSVRFGNPGPLTGRLTHSRVNRAAAVPQ
ncbi:MAG: hypothetical protein WCK21_06005, partial [Actinomycetota bacterium]